MITTEEKQMALAGHDLVVRANKTAHVLTFVRQDINQAGLDLLAALHHPDAALVRRAKDQIDVLYGVFMTLGEIQRAMEIRPDDAPPFPGSTVEWSMRAAPLE